MLEFFSSAEVTSLSVRFRTANKRNFRETVCLIFSCREHPSQRLEEKLRIVMRLDVQFNPKNTVSDEIRGTFGLQVGYLS